MPGNRTETHAHVASDNGLVSAPTDDSAPQDGAPGGALELVGRLCEALAAEEIRYCHWKSNNALDRSASGENDLDLLINRLDLRAFREILSRLGFKDASPPDVKAIPGVFHSYGLDHQSGRLVHIHAYVHLFLGDDMTKNYRLPVEDAYLQSTEQRRVFRVPSPEFELVVFVIRMALKHSTLDALLSLQGSLSARELREAHDLMGRADLEEARSLVREHLPFLGERLWNDCLACLLHRTPRRFRIQTAHLLERALAPYARRAPSLDAALRLARRSRLRLGRAIGRTPLRQRLDGGGALIAIVGGDGAGKSTAVEELYGWLSSELLTLKVHLGRPRWSLMSSGAQRMWNLTKLGRSSPPRARGSLPPGHTSSRGLRGSARLVRRVMVSRDRYLAYARARRFAARGGLVITDRYPLPEITLMDGAATKEMSTSQSADRLVRYLARLEGRYYGTIARPDVLLVLRVDPDVAVERKRGLDAEASVRPRAEEIWRVDWEGLQAVVIDADRPKDEVIEDAKSAIWSRL
jgi:thymidylate kinase